MANKLYPPYIEGTLPAFIENGGILTVPFELNRAVNRTEFSKMALLMKTVSTNTVVLNGQKSIGIEYDEQAGKWKALFSLEKMPLFNSSEIDNLETYAIDISEAHGKNDSVYVGTRGQYYKIQIAFVGTDANETIGYYSDVGIAKCTSQPLVEIENLNNTNVHRYEYVGKYSQVGGDSAEKVYSYRFDLRDEYGQIVATSGTQIHNASKDTENNMSTDSWLVSKDLEPGYSYTIQYIVTTLNNLNVASPAYKIMQIETVDFDIDSDLNAVMIPEDGYVKVSLRPRSSDTRNVTGNFLLLRGSSTDNYQSWQQLYDFQLVNQLPKMLLWKDFTVQQGVSYKYALQAYNNNGLYSNRLFNKEGPIQVDFEDAFLFDGERQLNIRFNPQVSSFKNVLLESKMDTLGGKYPFIFRNGNVNYHEFPISGLISLQSDPNELFVKGLRADPALDRRTSTAAKRESADTDMQLTAENFRREREFKLAVLEWLGDGKPKLFRSPGEGNYIVRLMNIQLQPNNTLGRMLHSFSCTAYEIADCTFKNLQDYHFVTAPVVDYREMKFTERKLSDFFATPLLPGQSYCAFQYGAYLLSTANQYQNDLVLTFNFLNGASANINIHNATGATNIKIGSSPVVSVVYEDGIIDPDATIMYGYYDDSPTHNFSHITSISVDDKIKQYIGGDINKNIIEDMEDIRSQAGRFYYIKLTPRYVIDIYYNEEDSSYYKDSDFSLSVDSWDPTALYHVQQAGYWLDGSPDKRISGKPNFTAYVNSTAYTDLGPIEHGDGVRTQGRFAAIKDVDDVQILRIGNGIILDVVYQLKTIEYAVEATNRLIAGSKSQWLEAKRDYEAGAASQTTVNSYYRKYVTQLANALNELQMEAQHVI